MNKAFVYVMTFSNGVKYFGNGTNPTRPYDMKDRSKTFKEQISLNGDPLVEVINNLSVEEAEVLEQTLFDEYVLLGGKPIQKRPNGYDLTNAVNGGVLGAEFGVLGKEHGHKGRDVLLDPVARARFEESLDRRYPNRHTKKFEKIAKAFKWFDKKVEKTLAKQRRHSF